MSSDSMSIEKGGQSDGYEDSLKNINEPHAKQAGALGGISAPNDLDDQRARELAEKGQKNVEKIMYGQKLSEEGMGGQTDGLAGNTANQGGYGEVDSQESSSAQAAEARKQQGYGKGSGVGA